MDNQEEVAVHMCCLDGLYRNNHFRGKPIRRNEVEVRVRKFTNGKTASKDEVTEEMIKGGDDKVVPGCRVCKMVLDSGGML